MAACLLGYPAEDTPSPIVPDTPAIFVPLLELEALAPGSWYLNVLATYPGFRGMGCGTKLLTFAETAARNAQRRTVSLIAADTHQAALRLYRSQGYTDVESRPVVKGDWQVDAQHWVLMTKAIA